MTYRYLFLSVHVSLFCIVAFGCAVGNPRQETAKSPFTHGNVQLTLKKGVTTQEEILNTFGAPNVATNDSDGNELWTYQKHATVVTNTEIDSYGTLILFGGTSSTTGFERSSRSMTLIIKFDSAKKVVDFKSLTTSF